MSDNFNEAAENAAEAEARKRAERIAAIRRSVRSSTESYTSSEEMAAKNALSAAEAALNGGTSPDSASELSWEDELAERIAKRVQKVKRTKANSAGEIVRELESSSSEPAKTAEDILNELSAPDEYRPSATAEDILKELSGSSYEADTAEYTEPEQYEEPAYETYEQPEESSYEAETAEYTEPEQYEEPAYETYEQPEENSYEAETAEYTEPEQPAEDITAEETEAATSEPVQEAEPVRAPKPLRKLSRLNSIPAAQTQQQEISAMPESVQPQEEQPVNAGTKKKKKKKKKKTFKEKVLGLFPQRQDSPLECIRKVVFLVAIAVILVCGYIVADYYLDLWRSKRENQKNMDNYWGVMEDSTQPSEHFDSDDREVLTLLSGARKLLDENSDVVGVIRIEGTPVNNPVMQAEDNSKYLNRKLSGRESRAGELFMDYRNFFDRVDAEGHRIRENSDNLVIYGHNMKDEQMFGSLKYYDWYDSYYGEHPVIDLNSNYKQYKYKIFAFFILDAEDDTETRFDCWNKLDFTSEEEFYEFVNEAKRRTLRLNDVDVKYGDKLLTLSTCNTVLGERGRLIVLARLVRDGEDPLEGTQNSKINPNIKWPSVYYDYKGTSNRYDPEAEFVPYGPSEEEKQKVSGDKK